MTSVHRFYLPQLAAENNEVRLPDDEARHLNRVLRLQTGTQVRVFDGQGHEREATVARTETRDVTVRLGCRVQIQAELPVHVTLAVSMLNGRKLDAVVRDSTMLGVSVVAPLRTARSRGGESLHDNARLVHRWHNIGISSAKQCGRAVVPTIDIPLTFSQFVEASTASKGLRILLVEPTATGSGGTITSLRALDALQRPATAIVAVGPEGGWSAGEIDRAEAAGFTLVTLGPRTLRAVAVPTVMLSVLQFLWLDL